MCRFSLWKIAEKRYLPNLKTGVVNLILDRAPLSFPPNPIHPKPLKDFTLWCGEIQPPLPLLTSLQKTSGFFFSAVRKNTNRKYFLRNLLQRINSNWICASWIFRYNIFTQWLMNKSIDWFKFTIWKFRKIILVIYKDVNI